MSETSQVTNKRIAKNTLLLYLRMLFLMLISLYTSRIILNALGVEDYGIYNVVGGVVSMFSIITASFSASVSRFMTFSLGKKNFERLSKVFSSSVIIQTIIAIFIIIIIELVGIWFLNNKLSIPEERLEAANWVMHCSILIFAVNLVTVPFNASIIAHEKMDIFAIISVFEGFLKLGMAFLVRVATTDKLVLYACLLLVISLVTFFLYSIYCRIKFPECKFHFIIEKPLLKEMTGFAGWTMLGNGAYMFNTQGVNIIINIFYGVTLNAARGVATQVESAVTQFVNSFMTALNPQITKSYAEGNINYMHALVCRGAKFSFFLMLFFAVPICIETEQILTIWLIIVPDYAIPFVRLTFVASMCTVLGNTLVTSQLATGKIKKYQIVVTLVGLWVFPLTWFAFYLGASPVWAYIIYSSIYFVLIFVRIYLVKDLIYLKWSRFIRDVLIKCLIVTLASLFLPMLIYHVQSPSISRLIEILITGFLSTAISIYILGLEKNERFFINDYIKRKWTGNR